MTVAKKKKTIPFEEVYYEPYAELIVGRDKAKIITHYKPDDKQNVESGPATVAGVNAKFVEHIKKFQPKLEIPTLLPQGTRFFESNETGQNFLMEVPPSVFPFRYDTILLTLERGGHVRGGDAHHELNENGEPITELDPTTGRMRYKTRVKKFEEAQVCVPWQYFWIKFNTVEANDYGITHTLGDVYLFWAHERIEHFDSLVYPAMLPNIEYKTGKICLGEVYPESGPAPLIRAEEIVNSFYESKFNGDLPIYLPYSSLGKWIETTKKNAYAWVDWGLPGNAVPLKMHVKSMAPLTPTKLNIGSLYDLLYSFISDVSYMEELARTAPPPMPKATFNYVQFNGQVQAITVNGNIIADNYAGAIVQHPAVPANAVEIQELVGNAEEAFEEDEHFYDEELHEIEEPHA